MKRKIIVSIVILNFNGKDVIGKCLESCFKLNFSRDDLEVIVVDNNSSDGSCDFIRDNFPKARVVKNRENKGSAGLNVAIGKAKGDFLFFLNNDDILSPDCVSYLLDAMALSQETGLCEAKELNSKDKEDVECAGTWVSRSFYCGRINKVKKAEKIVEIPYVGGAFIRKGVLKELGYLFDPDYFLYGEDLDLGLRARLIGKKTVYVPRAVIYHSPGTTTKKTHKEKKIVFFMERNLLMTFFKVTGTPRLFLYFTYVFGMRIFAILRDFILLKPSHSFARIKAVGWIVANRNKVLKKRRETQRMRKRSDSFVFKVFSEKELFKSFSVF